MRRYAALCLAAVLSVLLAGCVGQDDAPYSQDVVLAYVADAVPSEIYRLVSVEQIEQRPANVVYTFQSEQRPFTFTANSYLQQVWVDATPTAMYQKKITCSYAENVKRLYTEQVRDVLAQSPLYDSEHRWLSLLSFEDIAEAARVLHAASEVYAAELAYNDADFLRRYPAEEIHVAWYDSRDSMERHTDWVNLCTLPIDGVTSEQAYDEALTAAYARQVAVDGNAATGIDSADMEG